MMQLVKRSAGVAAILAVLLWFWRVHGEQRAALKLLAATPSARTALGIAASLCVSAI
jgi:hypothetical protein